MMRHYTRHYFVCFFLTLLVLALGVRAQDEESVPIAPAVPVVVDDAVILPDAEAPEPVFAVAASASDVCALATRLELSTGGSGGTTTVTAFTEDPNDPVLSCAWGTPSNPRGYRTAWYHFVAPRNGRVTIETLNSSYDTILAVYRDCNPAIPDCSECANLTAVACNDDANGLTSRLSFTVTKNVTYFIEVADYQSGISGGAATLGLAVWLVDVDSRWQQVISSPLPPTISRHALVKDGTNLYVVGGQSSSGVSSQVWRYATTTNTWATLAPIPGAGYANTTAALIDGKIYVPGGDNGNPNAFDGRHWVYNVATNGWSELIGASERVPQPNGVPFAYATAVASGNPAQKGYYLIGGLSSQPAFSGSAVVNNEVYFYFVDVNPDPNVVQGSWVNSEPLPVAQRRYAHTGAWVNGRVCIAGGLQDNPANTAFSVLLGNGLCLNPGGTWVETGQMNVPRYGAGSAVGPDGTWYVYGGFNESGEVPVVEVYVPATNSWRVLDITFDLGGTSLLPARFWPRGAFVGNNLWVVGGEYTGTALSLMERLYMPPLHSYLPLVMKGSEDLDDYPAVANSLALNVAELNNFNTITDLYDVYYFDLPTTRAVTVRLTQIPANSDYNIVLYDANKLVRGSSKNPGQLPEAITTTLGPGRYYIIVKRDFPAGDPNPANYLIVVEG